MSGDGKKARFWWDAWISDCPLKNRFPKHFLDLPTARLVCLRSFELGGS